MRSAGRSLPAEEDCAARDGLPPWNHDVATLANVGHCIVAGLLTTAAGLGAHAAMLVLAGVALALLAAGAAGSGANLEQLAQDLLIRARPPGGQGAPVAAQTSAQSRSRRMHCLSWSTIASARQASAQAVHAWAQA